MNIWINGRSGLRVDCRDRGLQYGDGVFESMRVRHYELRLLDYHLDRLYLGCRRLKLAGPPRQALRRELMRIAAQRREGVVKLIVTRGVGRRGYRPDGGERCTRIVTLHAMQGSAATGRPERVRLCRTQVCANPCLAGVKSLNRLESVIARMEWQDPRIWEGLMCDADENIVCGTMSNLFMKRGSFLMTPILDRGGVAGVMRRWVLKTASALQLQPLEGHIRWEDLRKADEVFMTNAVAGLRSVGSIERAGERVRPLNFDTAALLRARLHRL